MDFMRKRTFVISQSLLKDLDDIHKYYKINKATFVRMAIYHGLEKLEYGYRPIRKRYDTIKIKYDISLPDDIWFVFEDAMLQIEEDIEKSQEVLQKLWRDKSDEEKKQRLFLTKENKLTHSEMIEAFIRIEIDKYKCLIKEVLDDDTVDDERLLEQHNTVSFSVDIPYILYDKLCEEREKTGLKETQLYKYHLTSALVSEHQQNSFDTIYTDADLLINIEALGLPTFKTMTLIRNLIQSGKFAYKKDS